MERKIKYANVEQVRSYTKKDGTTTYKYMLHQEKWNKEKNKYDGWECVTVYSDVLHNYGDEISYSWERFPSGYGGKYVETTEINNQTTEENNFLI